jgi:hypothetical protein
MQKILVFIDEFGNAHTDLTKQGTFSHFVYAAIVIKEEDKIEAINARNYLSKKYFQSSPMKSSHISNDDRGFSKRLSILKDLKRLNYIIFSLVIDKKALKGDNLRNKDIFYKFFQRIFIQRFAENYTSFEICADEVGDQEFQKSLSEFIETHAIQRDLFNPDRSYRMAEDKEEEPLLQLSDFIAGTVGKIYCTSHMHPHADNLFEQIADRNFVEFFPFEKTNLFGISKSQNIEIDGKISEIAWNAATAYIDSIKKTTDVESKEVLSYLLLIFKIMPDKLVTTKELIKVVKKVSTGFTQQSLRQKIQGLRDTGVIIVSPQGKNGYKIPNCLDDMIGFFNRYLNSIIPMLRRIKIPNDKIKIKTIDEIDILHENNFSVLQEMINLIESKKGRE